MSISDFALIDKPKWVFFKEKGLSIREKSLIDKTGLPKKVWQYRLAMPLRKLIGTSILTDVIHIALISKLFEMGQQERTDQRESRFKESCLTNEPNHGYIFCGRRGQVSII